jgi:hypothetical protein
MQRNCESRSMPHDTFSSVGFRAMARRQCSVATLLLAGGAAQAGLVSGFESGLSGWMHMGDVSVQSAEIGLAPTQGSNLAFISTMDGRHNPYSGTAASAATLEFMGLPTSVDDFLAAMPPIPVLFYNPFGSAAKLSFFASGAGRLSFDFNKIGSDDDYAFLSLRSGDDAFMLNEWLYHGELPMGPTGVRLCERIFAISPPPFPGYCDLESGGGYNTQTGWRTRSLFVPRAGWYTIGFATGSAVDSGTPTVLALDNLNFTAPAPATALLAITALAAVALSRRRPVLRS